MEELKKENKNIEIDQGIQRLKLIEKKIQETKKTRKDNPNYSKELKELIVDAKSIAKKYKDIKPIQSEFLILLSKNHIYNEMDTVIEIINNEKFKESEKLNLLALKVLLNARRKKYFKNMEEICIRECFENSNNIQEKWIEVLGKYRPKGWIEEIDEIASRDIFKNISFIQNQYIIQLERYGTKESLEKALAILESGRITKTQNLPIRIEKIKNTLNKMIENQTNEIKVDEESLNIKENSESMKGRDNEMKDSKVVDASEGKKLLKKKKNKKDSKEIITLGNDFIDEITILKAKMAINSDMKMLNKLEIIEEKDSTDMRSRLELVLLLKKFGMEDVVEKRLSMENEIYNNINKFYKLKNQKSDLSVKKIKEGILKTVGADYKESTEKLLDEIEER